MFAILTSIVLIQHVIFEKKVRSVKILENLPYNNFLQADCGCRKASGVWEVPYSPDQQARETLSHNQYNVDERTTHGRWRTHQVGQRVCWAEEKQLGTTKVILKTEMNDFTHTPMHTCMHVHETKKLSSFLLLPAVYLHKQFGLRSGQNLC